MITNAEMYILGQPRCDVLSSAAHRPMNFLTPNRKITLNNREAFRRFIYMSANETISVIWEQFIKGNVEGEGRVGCCFHFEHRVVYDKTLWISFKQLLRGDYYLVVVVVVVLFLFLLQMESHHEPWDGKTS